MGSEMCIRDRVWPEQIHGLVKLGRACYGCMAGYTDISASTILNDNLSQPLPMWIQDGEKVVEAIGLTIAGSIMSAFGSLSLVSLGIIRKAFKTRSTTAPKGTRAPSIEMLEAIEGKPVRFIINNPPIGDSAWVGIYPLNSEDKDHGEEGEQWNWLSKINTNDVKFYEISAGHWSIRVFSDGGFTLDSRLDFEVLGKKERWWID